MLPLHGAQVPSLVRERRPHAIWYSQNINKNKRTRNPPLWRKTSVSMFGLSCEFWHVRKVLHLQRQLGKLQHLKQPYSPIPGPSQTGGEPRTPPRVTSFQWLCRSLWWMTPQRQQAEKLQNPCLAVRICVMYWNEPACWGSGTYWLQRKYWMLLSLWPQDWRERQGNYPQEAN